LSGLPSRPGPRLPPTAGALWPRAGAPAPSRSLTTPKPSAAPWPATTGTAFFPSRRTATASAFSSSRHTRSARPFMAARLHVANRGAARRLAGPAPRRARSTLPPKPRPRPAGRRRHGPGNSSSGSKARQPTPARSQPFAVREFASQELEWMIHRTIYNEQIDVFQVEYTNMGQYGRGFQRIAVCLFEHDIYFQSIARVLPSAAAQSVSRPAWNTSASALRTALLPQMDRVQTCTRENRDYLLSFLPELAPASTPTSAPASTSPDTLHVRWPRTPHHALPRQFPPRAQRRR
jgi:hypothetical protein